MLQGAEFGMDVIRILSDDTNVFMVLVYWVWKIQLHCSVHIEHWNEVVVDINVTCTELGPKCLQLMGMHVLSRCDTVSYPFNKGNISALNTLQGDDFPVLHQVLSEEDATRSDLMEIGQRLYAALYGQPLGTVMREARYRIYSRKEEGKAYVHHGITPTEVNLYLYVRRATSSNDAVEGS